MAARQDGCSKARTSAKHEKHVIHNGHVAFPRFQFDPDNGRVFRVAAAILKIRPPRISHLRVVYWMMRPDIDYGCAPAEVFGQKDAAVVVAFRRRVEPDWNWSSSVIGVRSRFNFFIRTSGLREVVPRG